MPGVWVPGGARSLQMNRTLLLASVVFDM